MKRDLIVAHKNLREVRARYPKRNVVADSYAPDDKVYYLNPKGHVRMLVLGSNTLWECDHEKGPPFMRRIK